MCVCLCVCLCVCFMGDNTLYWLTGELPPLQRKLKNNKKQQKQKQWKPALKVLLEDPGERKSPYFRDNWQEDIKNWGFWKFSDSVRYETALLSEKSKWICYFNRVIRQAKSYLPLFSVSNAQFVKFQQRYVVCRLAVGYWQINEVVPILAD